MKSVLIILMSIFSLQAMASDFSVTKSKNDISNVSLKKGESVNVSMCKDYGLNIEVQGNASAKRVVQSFLDNRANFEVMPTSNHQGIYLRSTVKKITKTSLRMKTVDNSLYILNIEATNDCPKNKKIVKVLYIEDSHE